MARRKSSHTPPPAKVPCLDARLLLWRDHPEAFVREALGIEPEAWQVAALQALASQDRLAIRSGHGVGKSAYLAWVVLWWLLTRFPAKAACTAPTGHQLSDILWGEIAKWHRKLPKALRTLLVLKADRLEWRAAPNEGFAVARTARRDQPEAFQGFHAKHMLFIADEASGIEEAIFEAGQGAMSTPGAKTIMTGNPTRVSGFFYRAFHEARQAWWTQVVPCSESRLVSPDYATSMAAQYGQQSNVYRVRVEGEFPLAEEDAVVPLFLAEAAIHREVPDAGRVLWGLDVARGGADRSALAKRRGPRLLEPVKAWQGKDLMQLCGLVLQEFDLTPDHLRPAAIYVDVIGLGAGVLDRLRELSLPAQPVNVAEAPKVEGRYHRLRDELWFAARDWLATREVAMPDDAALISELTSPRFSVTSRGRLKVEGKDEMRARGLRSPDLADAFCMTFAGRDMAERERGPRHQTALSDYNVFR